MCGERRRAGRMVGLMEGVEGDYMECLCLRCWGRCSCKAQALVKTATRNLA
jgi:hypothetical protein